MIFIALLVIGHKIVQTGHIRTILIGCTLGLCTTPVLCALHFKMLGLILGFLTSLAICFLVLFMLLHELDVKFPVFMGVLQGQLPCRLWMRWVPVRFIGMFVIGSMLIACGVLSFVGALRWLALNDKFFA